MVMVAVSDKPNSPLVNVRVELPPRGIHGEPVPKSGVPDLEAYGCHVIQINNLMCTVYQPPIVKTPNPWHTGISWEHIKATHSSKGAGASSMIIPPEVTTYGEYLSFFRVDVDKHPVVNIDDLPEKSKAVVAKEVLQKLLGGYNHTIIFAPVVNYLKQSRAGTTSPAADYYNTYAIIKLLMKYGGGSWYGLPVMANSNYSHRSFGDSVSLFQVVVWNKNSTGISPMLKDSRFELHPKGTGRWGPLVALKDWLKKRGAPKKVLDSTDDEQVEATYHSFRKLAEEIKATY